MDSLTMIRDMLKEASRITLVSLALVSLVGGYAVTRRTFPGQRAKRYAFCVVAIVAVWLCLVAVHKALMDSLYVPEWGTWILDSILLAAAVWWLIRYRLGDEKKVTPPTSDLMEAPRALQKGAAGREENTDEEDSDI